MILDARSIIDLQACPRKTLLGADWRVVRWRPKALFDACLRTGILQIAASGEAEVAADEVKARLLQTAANPGMDLPHGANPYVIARDYCAMLDTMLRAMAKAGLPKLRAAEPVAINASVSWQPQAFMGDDGLLHRFITIDHFGEDAARREVRGWGVAGDVAITGIPLTLHAIEIGQMRGGRRHSCWARAFKHPAMERLQLRFAKSDGSPLNGWKPVWLADQPGADPDAWTDRMIAEGAAKRAMHAVEVAPPDAATRAEVVGQVMQEAARIRRLLQDRGSIGYSALPMHRAACDTVHGQCTFWPVCNTANTVDIDRMGLYARSENGIVTAR